LFSVILTVTLNPSLDRTYLLGPLRLGEVNRAGADTVEASGKGVNVSWALHRAGVPTRALLPLGGTEGDHVRTLLDAGGLPYEAVPVAVPTRTNVTLVEAAGRTTKVNSPGRPLADAEYHRLAGAIGRLAGGAAWTVFSGTLPPDADPATLPRLIAAARDVGARIAVDASGAALEAAVDSRPDLLAPNAAELAALTGTPVPEHDLRAAARAAAGVAARTGGALLVSLGADGALWVAGGRARHAVPPRITPVNTAGAGDALLAGWLASAQGDPLARAVAWGTAACLLPGTTGDVAATADPAAVTVIEVPGRG
jgi:1-phosphofructokinase